jgi:hypothetical protein
MNAHDEVLRILKTVGSLSKMVAQLKEIKPHLTEPGLALPQEAEGMKSEDDMIGRGEPRE